MTLMETAQLLGNFGEFVGAIAVVGTLVYLAAQVGHSRYAVTENTRALRSSTYEAFNQSGSAWSTFQAANATAIAAIVKHTSLDQLEIDQMLVWSAYTSSTFGVMETTFLHHRAGSLDDDVFEARVKSFGAFFETSVGNSVPLLIETWGSSRGIYTPDFQQFLEDRVPILTTS